MKSHWIIECGECHKPLVKTKEKMGAGMVIYAESVKPLKALDSPLISGNCIYCKCGGTPGMNGKGGYGRRITDKTWIKLK